MLDATVQIDDAQSLYLLYVRDRNANFGIDFSGLKKIRMRVNGRYIGSRIENNWFGYYPVRNGLSDLAMETQKEYAEDGCLKHPDFLVFDANQMYSITPKVTLAASTDENYTEKDGYNMPGKSYIGKLTFRF